MLRSDYSIDDIMPQPGQRSVSIPEYVWEYARQYFEAHKKELRKRGIKSVSKLITVWVEEATRS